MSQLQKNATRIKNILDGNYTGKSKIQSGYTKQHYEHVEGDTWEELGKQWTIKNGIKQTVSKLDAVREFVSMPLCCPKCHVRMSKKLDKKFWKLKRQCFDCTIEEDTQRMINGTFAEYEKQMITNNVTAWVNEMEQVITQMVKDSKSNRFVTEDGQLEDWEGSHSNEELQTILDTQLTEFKDKAKEFIKEEK